MKVYSETTCSSYHLHLSTSNSSAIKMAALLQSMGVSNCTFMLRLDNKRLMHVNPYDPDLDMDTQLAIYEECQNNRWYFYREVFRVGENGAESGIGGGTHFIFNRGNLAYLWAMEMNINTYLIMPRQTGKTWAAVADCCWTHQFSKSSTIVHYNKTQKDANDNLTRIKDALSMLPLYLQHSSVDNLEPADKRKVKNNEKSIRNSINSLIECMASAGNASKADTMARGKTAQKIWFDEHAFIFFIEVISGATIPAFSKARENAMKNNAPYAISITTTPGDLATPHGEYSYKLMNRAIPFDESFYDLKPKKLYDRINNTPDKVPYLYVHYTYLQLGETEEWYLSRFKEMADPIRARREYLLEWMDSNGNSPFDPDDVELIGEIARERDLVKETLRINKYFEMNVYGEYHGNKPVLIGIDVAGSIGRDSSAIVVANPETLHPLAIFKSNMIELSKLRKLIMTIVKKLYPHCIMTIENNSVGQGLISELRETPVGRVLYKERKKKTVDQGPNAINRKRKIDAIEWGHNTNTITRAQMMETLESVVHGSPAHVGYPELYEEIRFLQLKNGRIDHGSATHDDAVMAYMGILWIVRYGTGLKGTGIYYNISDGMEEVEYSRNVDWSAADKLLKRSKNNEEDNGEDEVVSFMTTEQHVQTSADLARREREEYFKCIDKQAGIDYDYGYDSGIMPISDPTKELLTRSYRAMLESDLGADNDPISKLLRPIRMGQGGQYEFGDRKEEDWGTLYKM